MTCASEAHIGVGRSVPRVCPNKVPEIVDFRPVFIGTLVGVDELPNHRSSRQSHDQAGIRSGLLGEQLDLSHGGHAQQRPEVVIGELQRDLSPLGD